MKEIKNKIALKMRSKYEDYIDVDAFMLPEIVEEALRDLLYGEFEFENVHFYREFEFENVHFYRNKFALCDKFNCEFEVTYEDLHRRIVENYI